MSGIWVVPSKGAACVDDAVLTGVDMTGVPQGIYMMRWFGSYGEQLANHDSAFPIRSPVTNLAAWVHVFDRWMIEAMTPTSELFQRTLKGSPAITLSQAIYVKQRLVWGLYYNKSNPSTPGAALPDNTASVNAAVQGLASSTNSSLASLSSQINSMISGYAASNTGARSADAQALNASLESQNEGHTANISIANTNFGALSSYTIPSGGGSLPGMGGLGGVAPGSMPTTDVAPGTVSAPGVSTSGVTPGGGSGPTDPLAPIRDGHLNNLAAQTSVPAVAAYDITAGW
jgi:hypothetical protein